MQIDVPDFLLAISVVQALMLATFLLLPSNVGRVSNRLLVVVLVSIAAEYADLFLYAVGFTRRHPETAYLGTLFIALQAPALYLYTKSLMSRNFTLAPRHAVHLIPFGVAVVVFVFGYYLQTPAARARILLEQDLPGMPTSLPLAILAHGVLLAYLVYSIFVLQGFAKKVRNIFSDIESKQTDWLKLLLSGYALIWLVSLIYCLAFYIFKCTAELDHVLMIAGAAGFIFVNLLVMHALRQSGIFSGLTAEEEKLAEEPAAAEKELPLEKLKSDLEKLMAEEKPFLNANLSIAQLARQSGTTARDLSFVINRGFGRNFFDFIGEYRICHARALLDSPLEGRTILEIMYESGFNSKSVFNTAFREKTGMTPSQYRKQKIQA